MFYRFTPYFIRTTCSVLQVQNNMSLDHCHCISLHQCFKDLFSFGDEHVEGRTAGHLTLVYLTSLAKKRDSKKFFFNSIAI